jgi:diguanylate cyclase (GGDEF)-like protein
MRLRVDGQQGGLSNNVKVELLQNLLSSLPQAVGISLTSSIGAAFLACRSGTTVDLAIAIALAAIGLCRVTVLLLYRRHSSAAITLASLRPWYRWHAGGLLAQATTIGFQSLVAFITGDTAAALLALGFVLAFCAGATARLSVIPWIPIATTLLMFVPTIFGALLSTELPIKLAGVFLIIFIPVMLEATLHLHRLVVDRLIAVQEASYRARHDGLTGLANRTFFHEQLAEACKVEKSSKRDFVILYLDLDGFKAVNDQMGHAAGDRVLIAVADRLRSATETDHLVSRIGGDEFAILIRTEPHGRSVKTLTDRLTMAIAAPIHLQTRDVTVGVSIGVARSSGHAANASEILIAADQAMYAAKLKGKAGRRNISVDDTYARVA